MSEKAGEPASDGELSTNVDSPIATDSILFSRWDLRVRLTFGYAGSLLVLGRYFAKPDCRVSCGPIEWECPSMTKRIKWGAILYFESEPEGRGLRHHCNRGEYESRSAGSCVRCGVVDDRRSRWKCASGGCIALGNWILRGPRSQDHGGARTGKGSCVLCEVGIFADCGKDRVRIESMLFCG